jgi:uncharacterized protein (TIGR02680 family)
MTNPLPSAAAPRWQPLRAGLADMFYYDTQEFWFRDGRLLLRGNNGTGKSKVLALLLPFLLDGDLSPHRVEPDADPKKRMEWNLLLGGAHPHPERIGYSWLEFGRIDEDGVSHYRTIGCGMKAVTGRGIASHWFFVTSGRIGGDLELVDKQGFPLTKERLGEELGELGERYDRAREYRRAVDEALFGLGEQRYGALVDLLIQLRQPQLSKRPSEKVLSQALTESLPPLDQAILADVAEAFRSLQEDRDELVDMREALDGTRSFLQHYRGYARIASRRKATAVRQSHSRYEKVNADLNKERIARTELAERERALRHDLEIVSDTEAVLTERRQALHDSAAMGAANELDSARKLAEQLAKTAEYADGQCRDAETTAASRRARHAEAEQVAAAAAAAFAARRATADRMAEQAALRERHAGEIAAALDEDAATDTVRTIEAEIVRSQQMAIKHLRNLLAQADEAQRHLQAARGRVDEIDTQIGDNAERRITAEAELAAAAAALTRATAEHFRRARELAPANLAEVLEELAEWTTTQGGDNPAATAARIRHDELIEQISRADATAEAEHHRLTAARDELLTQQHRLESGGVDAPPAWHTRDARIRLDRDGAPLWQLVDFRDGVSDSARAGLEAALEAAGILDAWVEPDGVLRAAGSGDVIAVAAGAAAGPTLADHLTVAINEDDPHARAVSAEVIANVLRAIGIGSDHNNHTWVAADGRFRVGVLDGVWHKPDAQYIGAGARERARQQRLAELRHEIATVQAGLDDVAETRRNLRERHATVRDELATMPSEAQLRAAHQEVSVVVREHLRLAEDRRAAVDRLDAATATHTAAVAERDQAAVDCGLPADRAALERVVEALNDYRIAMQAVLSGLDSLRDAARRARETADESERAAQRLAEAADYAAAQRREAMAARERFETLSDSVGAEVAELQERLAAIKAEFERNNNLGKSLRRQLDSAIHDRGISEGKLAELGEMLHRERDARDLATTSLRRFVDTGLPAVALADTMPPDAAEAWSAAAAISFARAVDSELADVAEDDQALDRSQKRVTEEHKNLTDLLSRQGNSTSAALREDGIVVEVVFRGKPTTVPALAAGLAEEVADRSRLLTEREREILENHLVSEVACALQELILAAERQVLNMNGELESRPTSTGMKLKLEWQQADTAPVGAKDALRLLRRTADVWNESDRAAVGEFLQQEIERVRIAEPTGTWLEHLTNALDYRQWNKFVIKRHQNGQWHSATGPASGGERVLAASVPLFAAASAHYGSAGNAHAPRLVMLDEAFAGVDDNARAKYLGLLAAFDLDVVMTSEREWGCYPEVPGLAIAQLSRTDDVAAVLVTNWEWDGAERRRVDPPAPHLVSVGPAVAGDSTEQDGLWP